MKDLSAKDAAALAKQGYVPYYETPVSNTEERRANPRARSRLRSAKLIDANNAFLCEALIQDLSWGGMRLRLGRNIGLPARFGVHDDSSGALCTVSQVWRRDLTIGVRVLRGGPPSPMKPSEQAALAGRYYGIRG